MRLSRGRRRFDGDGEVLLIYSVFDRYREIECCFDDCIVLISYGGGGIAYIRQGATSLLDCEWF